MMTRRKSQFICFLGSTILLIFLLFIQLKFVQRKSIFEMDVRKQRGAFQYEKDDDIPFECQCTHENVVYDFCYHLPENENIYGKAFDCKNAHYLKRLNLLPDKRFKNKPSLNVNPLPEIGMVTAFSANHFHEALEMLASVRQFWPEQEILFYDVGLDEKQAEFMRNLCNVVYRKFNFNDYPEYVKRMKEYRWKLIIIAEALNDYKTIWWLDASARFLHGNLSEVYDLHRCKQNIEFASLQSLCGSTVTNTAMRKECAILPTLVRQLQREEILGNCTKTDLLLHSYTYHSNFATTHPDFYRYIPSNIEKLKGTPQLETNIMLLANSPSVRNILRWAVACALQDECHAHGRRTEFKLDCTFDLDRYRIYADCHRYDQSLVNVLMANEYFYEHHYYISGKTDFFNIKREVTRNITDDMLKCS